MAPAPGRGLGDQARLEHEVEVLVLGLPCVFSSSSAALTEVAARCFAPRTTPREAGAQPLRITLVLSGDPAAAPGPLRLIRRSHAGHFLAASGETLLSAQTGQGQGLAFVPPALLADEPGLRYEVIERLALLLASHRDRAPVHAAALAAGPRAVALAGDGGVSKATLAYAALKAGMGLLAAEVVYVSLAPTPRIWGHTRRLQLEPDARRFFPELAGIAPQVQADGKPQLVVEPPPGQLVASAEPAALCLLEHLPGQASRLTAIPAEEAVAALCAQAEGGLDLPAERLPAAAAALAARGAYRLQVGDPRSAVALLAALLERP